jgi:hypothetical protein
MRIPRLAIQSIPCQVPLKRHSIRKGQQNLYYSQPTQFSQNQQFTQQNPLLFSQLVLEFHQNDGVIRKWCHDKKDFFKITSMSSFSLRNLPKIQFREKSEFAQKSSSKWIFRDGSKAQFIEPFQFFFIGKSHPKSMVDGWWSLFKFVI